VVHVQGEKNCCQRRALAVARQLAAICFAAPLAAAPPTAVAQPAGPTSPQSAISAATTVLPPSPPLSCIMGEKGALYCGGASATGSGLQCQAWTSQSPLSVVVWCLEYYRSTFRMMFGELELEVNPMWWYHTPAPWPCVVDLRRGQYFHKKSYGAWGEGW
jgi:hypothetical protein